MKSPIHSPSKIPILYLLVKIVATTSILIVSTANAIELSENDKKCITDAKRNDSYFVNTAFLSKYKKHLRTEQFDQEAWEIICKDNSALQAANCVRTVYNYFKTREDSVLMRPWGLARVCSGGVTGELAKNCIVRAEKNFPQDEWPTYNAICMGFEHRYTACEHHDEIAKICPQGNNEAGSGTKARE